MKKHLKILVISIIFIGISVSLSIIPAFANSVSPSSSWIDNNFTRSAADLENPTTASISDIEFSSSYGSAADTWAQVGINTLLGGYKVYVPSGDKIVLTLEWTITGETFAGSSLYGTEYTENDFAAVICSASTNCLSTNSVSEPNPPSINHLSIAIVKLHDTAFHTSYINHIVSISTAYQPGSGTYVSFASYIWSYGGGNGPSGYDSEFTNSFSSNILAQVCNQYYCHVALTSVSYSIISGTF